MGTGWSEPDEGTADALLDAEVGDIISVDFIRDDITVEQIEEQDMMESGGSVKIIMGQTNRGGRHALLLWKDAAVSDATTGDTLDWEYAVKNKRWRTDNNRWQNNSDTFEHAEIAEKATLYGITMTAHTGMKVRADSAEDAWEKAKSKINTSWNIADDVNADELYVDHEYDDLYSVSLSALNYFERRFVEVPDTIDPMEHGMRTAGEPFHSYEVDSIDELGDS